jgi:catechol 2,3-dioxygenase-like lactoylglutathione lyase family enzyme
MGYRINHIHLKAPDPRRTADWYVQAFDFKIVSDETRVFGDRFVRCQSADGGINVNISGARAGERLGPGDASPHHGLEHFGFDSADLSGAWRSWARSCWKGRPRSPAGRASPSCGARTTRGWS